MTRPLKILFLSHVKGDPNGGASRIYFMLSEALRARGHAVDLYHQEDFGLPSHPRLSLAAQRFALPRYVSRFAATLKLEDYDIVMSSSGMAAPLFSQLAGAAKRPALVNHLHGLSVYDHLANVVEDTLGHRKTTRLYKLVTGPNQIRWDLAGIRTADLTITQNLRDLSWVRARMPAGAEVIKIPAAVYPDLLGASADCAPPEGRSPDEILSFGTWESRKGSHYLPAAFRQIRRARPQARLVVGGTGKPEAVIRALFDEADRASVHVLPRISVEEQIVRFNTASIFLFPSLSEGFGLALVEAMCFGMACVTTDTAFGGDELTDRLNARVVFPSSEHIARAAIELAAQDTARHDMARRGRALARTFDMDRMVTAYEAAFQRLAAGA